MGDDRMNESESVDAVRAESVVDEPAITITDDPLVYRLLPVDEWPHALPFLSYCSPGQLIILDPDSQSLIVAEDPAGNIVGAAIASGVFHIAYLLPLKKEVNILTMQREAEALLPPGSLYYTMTHDGDEADALQSELGMQRIDGAAVLVKKKT